MNWMSERNVPETEYWTKFQWELSREAKAPEADGSARWSDRPERDYVPDWVEVRPVPAYSGMPSGRMGPKF